MEKRMYWAWAALGLATAGIWAVAVQRMNWPQGETAALAPATSTPAEVAQRPAANRVTMETLGAGLASGDERIRGEARALLKTVSYGKRAWLTGLAEDTGDAHAKEQIRQRLDEIEEQLATDPPPIALHVKDATLADVTFALNEEMGTHMQCDGFGTPPPGLYTLDVENKPFWEVIATLHKQRPFYIDGFDGDLMYLRDSRGMSMDRYAISGPFFCYVRTESLDNTRPPSFMVNYEVLADSRMHIADLHVNMSEGESDECATVGPDSSGNIFKFMSRGGRYDGHSAACGYHGNLQIIWPQNPGKAISWMKVKVGFLTAEPGGVEQSEALKEGWETKTLGDVKVKVTKLELKREPGTVMRVRTQISCQVTPPEKAPLVTMTLRGGNGDVLWTRTPTATEAASGIVSGGGLEFVRGEEKPQRLEVQVAKRTHRFSPVFEFKDIPLPAREAAPGKLP